MKFCHYHKPQAAQILSVRFSGLSENVKQQAKFSYLFSFKSYYCLNSKIDAVNRADHNFSTIPSVKILSVVSNSTGLQTRWTEFELPVP